MHHVYDETPVDNISTRTGLPIHEQTNSLYDKHVGLSSPIDTVEQIDTSQYRQRGYQVGSLKTGPDDPDNYYKQPGHPLSPLADKGGRFNP